MYKISIILLLAVTFGYAQVSYKFSELRGIEDKQGNTQLFYRLYYYSPEYSSWWGPYEENSVYRYEPEKDSQYHFLNESGWRDVQYSEINDYNFPGNDYNNVYYLNTYYTSTEPIGAIKKNDEYLASFDSIPELFWQTGRKIELSRQDTNFIFAAFDLHNYISTDYGETWSYFAENYHLISVSPFDHNVCFSLGPGGIHKSTDMGSIFILADTGNYYNSKIYYDRDSLHVYSIKNGHELIVSDKKGNPFTWNTCHSTVSNVPVLAVDTSNSGSIFIADGKTIYHSDDYGKSFSLYKTLDRNIVGLYKKPGSDILFAVTSYDLYDIRPDSVMILKHLQQGDEVLEWYPLAIGNRWFYNYEMSIDTDYEHGRIASEVTDIIKQGDEKFYELTVKESKYGTEEIIINKNYLLIDSFNGRLYSAQTSGDSLTKGVLLLDITMQNEDTLFVNEHEFLTCWNDHIRIWDISRRTKQFYNSRDMFTYTFIEGFGVYEEKFVELTNYTKTLTGAVLRGIVYGDTLFTDVKNSDIVLPEYSLSQNYPNPFNPETNIKYSIKIRGTVTLKVYDVLGKEVATLVNEDKPAGDYEVTFNGSGLASGVYIYRMTSGMFSQSKKLLLIK